MAARFNPFTGRLYPATAGGGGGSGIESVVEDTSPQLGGDLDTNGNNIEFDDNTGIWDDSGNEMLIFQKTASAVNYIEITNRDTGNAPLIAAVGSDDNINLDLAGKGNGSVTKSGAEIATLGDVETFTNKTLTSPILEGGTVIGDFTIDDAETATKNYRFKTSGGALDFDFAGTNLYLSGYPDADFGGTQLKYLVAKSGSHVMQALGDWEFKAANNEFGDTFAWIGDDKFVYNESGADIDFRVEGDTDENMIFGDAGNNRLGIGTATPAAKLDVNGAARYIFTAEPVADHTADGPMMSLLNAGESITIMNLVYLSTSDGEWHNVDADAESTTAGLLGIALGTGTDGNALTVALKGSVVRDDTWAWTVGQTLYASTTPGGITATAPSATDDVVRVVGYAVTDDAILFSPDETYIVHA